MAGRPHILRRRSPQSNPPSPRQRYHRSLLAHSPLTTSESPLPQDPMSSKAPPSQFRPRSRPIPISRLSPDHRAREIRMLTEVRDELLTKMQQLDMILPGCRHSEITPIACRLHGVPWTTCPSCSRGAK